MFKNEHLQKESPTFEEKSNYFRMDINVSTQEKEYSNQIYNLLLYLSIFLIVYNAYFQFEACLLYTSRCV